MDQHIIEVAAKAVQIYAESHPRPLHVNQLQAAQMLNKSHVTVRKMIRAGVIRLNDCGDATDQPPEPAPEAPFSAQIRASFQTNTTGKAPILSLAIR